MLTPHHHHGKPGDEQRSRQHQDIGKFVRFKDDAHRLGCPRTDRWSRIDMRSHLPLVLAAFALTAPYSAKAAPASHGTHHVDAALAAALKAPTRTPANVGSDRYNHPAETQGSIGIRHPPKVGEIRARPDVHPVREKWR